MSLSHEMSQPSWAFPVTALILCGGRGRRMGRDKAWLPWRDRPMLQHLARRFELWKVPVHIVLCGTESGVNEDYLEIAYKTKGSIHTIEQDIDDLAQLADGATITIGHYKYRVSRGKFIQVSRI